MKKRILLTSAAVAAVGAFALSAAHAEGTYEGSSFREVWAQVASDPYATLPQDEVTVGKFFGFFENKILDSARRTLSTRSDLLPRFEKLVHPNGICLSGTWNITADTPYTGLFKKGSQALILGRASTALTATKRGEYRAFGFAGKLFPTTDANAAVPTANFFTIEDLGGTLTEHFVDAENTNDIIKVSLTPSAFMNTAVGAAVVKAFLLADQTIDVTQPLVRQLYPIAEAGEADASKAVSPQWMKIVGSSDVRRVDAEDFRDELRMENYPNGLRFDIATADVGTRLGPKQWQTIGYIEVTETVASDSCDHRLHFSHPRFRR